jgi:hypothetical protein
MTPKIKNILIFVTIAIIFVLIYIFFIKPSPKQPSLISSPSNNTLPNVDGTPADTNADGTLVPTDEFLTLLSGIRSIKLDDSIFNNPAFASLTDSSIVLVPDGTEGRPNPFAQFGNDTASTPPLTPPTCTLPQVLDSATNTCVNPSSN